MNDYIFLGAKKHGCKIDNADRKITYYDYLSLFEKLIKKNRIITLHYSQISKIRVTYGMTLGYSFDSAQLTLEVKMSDERTYDIPISYHNTKNDDIKTCIKLLQESMLPIDDPHQILNQFLESNVHLTDFIKDTHKQIYVKK